MAGFLSEMKKILADVQSGAFAKEWIEECDAGWPNMSRLRQESLDHPIEKVGKELRSMMSWLERPPTLSSDAQESETIEDEQVEPRFVV